jgi:hypothetical protein
MKSCCIHAWPRSSRGLSCSRRRPGSAKAVTKIPGWCTREGGCLAPAAGTPRIDPHLLRCSGPRNARTRPRLRSDYTSTTLLTTYRVHATGLASSLIEGVSGDDPEGGAGSGVLRQRLVTVCPGRPGKPPARHYDLAARSSLHGSGGNAGDGSAAPGEKPPRWSAERRASRVMGRKAPRKRLACRVMCRPNGCLARTRTSLGAPPTPRFG